MQKTYPSDIMRKQDEIIKRRLEESSKKTRPQIRDLYEILRAILRLVKESVSWLAIPHDYPNRNIVCYRFAKWSKKYGNGLSTLDKVLADITATQRLSNDKEPKPTASIVDSKSIPNSSSAGVKGMTRGKNFRRKNTYRSGFTRILKVFCDAGYTGEKFAAEIGKLLGAVVEVVKRNELHKFVVLPKLWIVERTFSRLDKYRRFWRNSERYTKTSEQLATMAFIRLILKRY